MRCCLIAFLVLGGAVVSRADPQAQKIEGMLIGSFIGDAAGGPPEFQEPVRSEWVTRGEPLDEAAIGELAGLFSMAAYGRVAEPYAHWADFAPAGTITDDSRHKILFLESVRATGGVVDRREFAESMVDWFESSTRPFPELRREGLREYVKAAYWELGDRQRGLPLQRLWGGIPTQAGQMFLLPVAGLFPGKPREAYVAAYTVNFVDVGIAKDISSALVAGLAEALRPGADWAAVERAMRETDPYEFGEVPWVERRFVEWLDKAKEFARESGGDPGELFSLLEQRLETRQWWDAWVPHTVFFAIAEITGYNPLATLQLISEFGHDTDSYAQLAGAFFGALHGPEVFPQEMRDLVELRLKDQYNVRFDALVEIMTSTSGD